MLYFVVLEFLAQNLLSINCLLRFIAPLFYRFGSPAIGLGILKSKSPTLSKPPLLVQFWLNFEMACIGLPVCCGSWTLWTCINFG